MNLGKSRFADRVKVVPRKRYKAVVVGPLEMGFNRSVELTAFEAEQLARLILEAVEEARKP